jgi:hypothetical protein
MYPEYLLDPVKASDSNATNISLLCDYLLDLEPEEADETVISNNSFLNEEIVYFTDIDKTLLTAEIEADIAENCEIYLVAEYKGFKSEKILLKDGIQEYGILFDGKIDDSNIVLTLSGKQYAEDVFLYEPYYENGETARSASQTMAGYSAWTLPVYVEKTINFNNIEETTSIVETTSEVILSLVLINMLTINIAITGPIDARATKPKPSSWLFLPDLTAQIPSPNAIMNGTDIAPVVTPIASNDSGKKLLGANIHNTNANRYVIIRTVLIDNLNIHRILN